MTLFADTLPPAAPSIAVASVEVMFWIFIVVSFLCVVRYGTEQIKAGTLINGKNGPVPFNLSGPSGWFFVVCVLQMIFLQWIGYVILVFVGIAGLLIENQRTAEEQFGFGRLKLWTLLSWSLLGFGAVMLLEEPLMTVSTKLLDWIQVPHPEQESVEAFRHFSDPSTILWFTFYASCLVPIIEELFFRGFLLTFLKKYTSTWLALILSSGVFAFAHLNLSVALPLWLLGFVLGLAYEHTGCLLLPIGIHACWNLAAALNLLLDKGSS